MLDTTMKQQLKTYLGNLKTPVALIANIGDGPKAGEMQQLVEDIVELSPLVSAEFIENRAERAPSMRVRSENNTDIRFSGLPMGHEFTSLVLALLHSGGHPIKIEPELIEQVRNLNGSFAFKTFISLSCQTCPDVVQALNMMAAINPNITHEMIDGGIFPEEVESHKIMSVPTVFLNEEQFSQGRLSLEDILSKVDTAGDAKRAEAITEKDPFDFMIIGGGPAGAAAAVYGARKGIRTGIVADDFGGQLLDTMSIENFISVKATDGPHMVASLEEHVKQYDVDIMNKQRATKIDELSDKDGLITVSLESGAQVKSKAVLLATGARWRELNVPGEQEYKGRGVAYCPHCDGPLYKGKRVAVVGGGNSGVEAAIDLAGIVKEVTLLEFSDKLIADEVLQNKLYSLPNVTVLLNAKTTEVQGDSDKVTGLVYTNRETQKSHDVALDGIFVQIGLVPNTEFLEGDVELSPRGEIIVGAHGETSMSGVFAAGDVTTVAFKQIIIAMGSGAHAALGAFDYLIRTPAIEGGVEQVQTVLA